MAAIKFTTSEGTNTKEVKDEAGNIIKPAVITRQIEVEYNFGDTIEEAIELFGKDVVFSSFLAAAKVDAQALVRRYLKSNVPAVEGVSSERPYTDDEIKAKLAAWKPGVKSERTAASISDKAEAILGKMTDAQKLEFLQKLQAMAGA